MKNSIILLLAGIAAAAISCQKEPLGSAPQADSSERGFISISLGSGPSTKAAADVSLQDLDRTVSDVQIAIFNASSSRDAGYRQFYSSYGAQTLENDNTTPDLETISLPVGDYTVYAVVNGPDVSGTSTLDALLATVAPFDEWNGTNSNEAGASSAVHNLVQTGSASVTVGTAQTQAAPAKVVVPVKRLASRVKLASVTNNLPEGYGEVKLKRAFLANVVKNENLGAELNLSATAWNAAVTSGVESFWGNCWGRSSIADKASIIGTGSNAAYSPENTFCDYRQAVSIASGAASEAPAHYFYCYANPSLDYIEDPTAINESGWDASKATTELVAVVEVFDGSGSLGERYYRVPLRYNSTGHGVTSQRTDEKGLLPNHAYSVALTLTALGPEDFTTIEKGCCSFEIKVSDWDAGDYMETVL